MSRSNKRRDGDDDDSESEIYTPEDALNEIRKEIKDKGGLKDNRIIQYETTIGSEPAKGAVWVQLAPLGSGKVLTVSINGMPLAVQYTTTKVERGQILEVQTQADISYTSAPQPTDDSSNNPNSDTPNGNSAPEVTQTPTTQNRQLTAQATTYYDQNNTPVYTGILKNPPSSKTNSSSNPGLIAATSLFAILFALTVLALFLFWRRHRTTKAGSDIETHPSPTSSSADPTEKRPAVVGAVPRGGGANDLPEPLPDFYLVPHDDNSLCSVFNSAYRTLCDHAYEYYSSPTTNWSKLPRELKNAIRDVFPKAHTLFASSCAELIMGVLAAKIWEEERKGEFLPGGRAMQRLLLQNSAYWRERDAKVANLTAVLLGLVAPLAAGREELRRASLMKVVAKVADLSLLIAFQKGGYYVFENADGVQGMGGADVVGERVVDGVMKVVGGSGGVVEGVVWPGFGKGGNGDSIVLEALRVVSGV